LRRFYIDGVGSNISAFRKFLWLLSKPDELYWQKLKFLHIIIYMCNYNLVYFVNKTRNNEVLIFKNKMLVYNLFYLVPNYTNFHDLKS